MQTDVGFMQMPATTIDDAVRLAEWVDKQQKNSYFALATFKEEYKNEKGKRRIKRKRKNVDQLKALWVDIDYKSCAPATHVGALQALTSFLSKTGFPKPTAMVSSGNGLHMYWPLGTAIGLEDWLPIAEGFKSLCQREGLPADHACTADASRVLRPVGTHNWKDMGNPKPVVWVGGSGGTYTPDSLIAALRQCSVEPTSNKRVLQKPSGRSGGEHGGEDGLGHLPEHLRKATEGSSSASEYTHGTGKRPQNAKSVFQKCAALRSILSTGGAFQDEPEWSATLTLLAHLDDGAKFVHAMSEKHPDYDADTTMEKWQQKVEAVEDGTGPTLCSTFETWHEDKCKACPFYKSKKVKTPKSLAYMDDPATPKDDKSPSLKLMPVGHKINYPRNWRMGGNQDCIERSIWNDETKQYEWTPVLRQVWELRKARRSIQSDKFELALTNKHGVSTRKFEVPSWFLGSNPDLSKALADNGCPIVDPNEFKEFRKLMQTWLDELRKQNNIEDITGQLGWIIDTDTDERPIIGFATGTSAYYINGDVREGVVAAVGKYKGIVDSFKPNGRLEPWKDAAAAIVDQGCDHLITLLATSFAAPLMRFTDQPGAVVSIVSEDSAAGKSTGLRLAQAVWGNPRHAPATMDDTQTVVKNKLAFLQNLPAYWDEVRGDEQKMQSFIQIAFQVAQGRDRERANSKAETIRAEEWQTLLAACSNESLFDLAAERAAESNAGIYRIFECKVAPSEYPIHDSEIMSLISQLDTNYGLAGLEYAKYLVDNFEAVRNEVQTFRLVLEKKTNLQGPERFWIAAITAMVLGARYAGKAGLVQIDTKRLLNYLINSLHKLRARAVVGKQRLSPRELVAAYAQQHQDGKVTVDWFPQAPGGKREPMLEGNHSHVRKAMYVEATEINCMMVSKSDFRTWLEKSKNLKWNDKLIHGFERDLQMVEKKCQLAAGTKFKLPRSQCLIFDLNERDDNAE